MKAPKYVIYTDHLVDWNYRDEYLEIEANNFIEAFTTANNMIENDETLYLIRIYEAIKGTRNKEYKRVSNVRPHNILEVMNDYSITRHTADGMIWYD